MSRHRSYCFTLNNYTSDDETRIQDADCSYIIYGRETAPSTGTVHLQGYVRFTNPKSLTAAKALLSPSAHLEVAKGSATQNRTYCAKDGDFYEDGQCPSQGKRNDLVKIKELIDTNPTTSTLSLYEEAFAPMVRYSRSILAYRALKTPPRRHKTVVLWLYGPTGSGKSRHAYDAFPDAYSKSVSNKWWDGYDNHEAVILDDLRPTHFTFNFLLKLFDRYPMQVEVKGSSVQFVAKTIIVTTSMDAKTFAETASFEDSEQLLRRITDETPY